MQVFAGLLVEGSTDLRFLESIVERTLIEVAFDCSSQIDIEVLLIEVKSAGLNFPEQVLEAAKKGWEEFGIQILCVQTDADHRDASIAYENKISPSIIELEEKDKDQYCKILVAVVPIQMMEAWMLADIELLKEEIGTQKSDRELGVHRQPETIANPKQTIQDAIRLARANLTKRRRKDLTIADLYLPIGQRLELEKLEALSSYEDFRNNVEEAFRKLNLLH